jgi:uncharacterized protein with HEPN domain
MRPECVTHLEDVARVAKAILRFVSGRSLADYESDLMLRSAVERQFLIVGEALTRIRRDEPALLSSISHSHRIISFRNILAHDYARVLDLTVWGIILGGLTPLIEEVEALGRSGHAEHDESNATDRPS